MVWSYVAVPTAVDPDGQRAGAALGLPLAAGLAATALLAGCGGSDSAAPPAEFFAIESAPTRSHILGVSAAGATESAGQPLPTVTQLLDWAELTYPTLLPGRESNQTSAPYVYRFYPATQLYVGVAGSEVYLLGPITEGQVTRVGSLADFAPRVFATAYAYTDQAAARFLQQAQFSSTPAEIAAVRSAGYMAWLQQQFEVTVAETSWDWLRRKGYGEINSSEFFTCQSYATNYVVMKDLWTAPDAVRKRFALALSEFFVISAPSVVENWCQFVHATYWDMLNTGAFGNFRALLEEVTLSLAMGLFLNTEGNQKEDSATKRQPDENYAREVMQLFTIGLHQLNLDGSVRRDAAGAALESFGQDDVRNLARVFTGYVRDRSDGMQATGLPPPVNITIPRVENMRRRMRLDPTRHSLLAKQFLGVSVPAGTPGDPSLKIALDTLFNHPNVGPFFGRQMIQRLTTSNPSPGYVARVATAFNDNGRGVRGDLRAVWRAILLDEEARAGESSADLSFGKVREPMLRFAQWGRTFGITSTYDYWKAGPSDAADPFQQLGQHPLRAPSVFGFFRPGYVPPGTVMALTGATAPEFQIVNESTVSSYINFLCGPIMSAGIYVPNPDIPAAGRPATTPNAGLDMQVDYSTEIALVPDWPRLVDRLSLLMCAGQLSATSSALITRALGSLWLAGVNGDADGKRKMVGYALLYVMASPDYIVQK